MCPQYLRMKNQVNILNIWLILFSFALKMDINVYYSTILLGIIGNHL